MGKKRSLRMCECLPNTHDCCLTFLQRHKGTQTTSETMKKLVISKFVVLPPVLSYGKIFIYSRSVDYFSCNMKLWQNFNWNSGISFVPGCSLVRRLYHNACYIEFLLYEMSTHLHTSKRAYTRCCQGTIYNTLSSMFVGHG